MESSAAILLRRVRYSETSLILTWLTLEHGKLKTMARGALRPKSAFAGRIDLFFQSDIAFRRSQRSEIHALHESTLLDPHEGLRRDFRQVELAAYFVELLDRATEPEHPVPELYDLLERALGHLGEHPASRRALLHFETELVRLLGLPTGETASIALSRVFHALPPGRERLLERLPASG